MCLFCYVTKGSISFDMIHYHHDNDNKLFYLTKYKIKLKTIYVVSREVISIENLNI